MIRLPHLVELAILRLEAAGYEGWAVGGCIRDSLLGKQPTDWDLCTNALPEQVKAVFKEERIVETGIRHGTVTLHLDGLPIEITTYRTESGYSDHRRPDRVEFVSSLEEDLSRRDFTINAIAYTPSRGIADPFFGQRDLADKRIRCVGNGMIRFEEDALRILRLFRLSAQLDFSIDEDSLAAAACKRELLRHVAAERISAELRRLLVCENPYPALRMMTDSGVLSVILPEFSPAIGFDQHSPYHDKPVDEHILRSVGFAPADPVIRITMLLHDIGKPYSFQAENGGRRRFRGHAKKSGELAGQILRRLRMDNQTTRQVVELVLLHDRTVYPERKKILRHLAQIGEQAMRRLIAVQTADDLAKNPLYVSERLKGYRDAARILEEILAEKPCLTLSQLAVNGNDLLAMGIPQSEEIGRILNHLHRQVIKENLPNDRFILLREAGHLSDTPPERR